MTKNWEEEFLNILMFAQSLPWTQPIDHDCEAEDLKEMGAFDQSSKIFMGLSQYLVEHIMMTTFTESLNRIMDLGGDIDGPALRMELVSTSKKMFEEMSRNSGVKFPNIDDLINEYLEGLLVEREIRVNGHQIADTCIKDTEYCHWPMGCPARHRDVTPKYPSINSLLKLEKDHYPPKSKLRDVGGRYPNGVNLCSMHNKHWKTNFYVYALPVELYKTERK